jgi:hypothetical protein
MEWYESGEDTPQGLEWGLGLLVVCVLSELFAAGLWLFGTQMVGGVMAALGLR